MQILRFASKSPTPLVRLCVSLVYEGDKSMLKFGFNTINILFFLRINHYYKETKIPL